MRRSTSTVTVLVILSLTTRPVIALPVAGKYLDGLDSLLAMVQMPKGVPVATVGVGQAENAALLAAQMLGLSDPEIASAVENHRAEARRQVEEDPTNRA